MEKNVEYLKIFTEMANNLFGKDYIKISSNVECTRMEVQIMTEPLGVNAYTFFTEGGFIIMNKTFKFCSPGFFREYTVQVLNDVCKPIIKRLYISGAIETLPVCMKDIKMPEYDLDMLTSEEFTKLFLESTDDVSNGETVDSIDSYVSSSERVTFHFTIDGGRRGIHRNNSFSITNRGHVHTRLCEMLEGGGVEDELENKILKLCLIHQK